MNHLKCIEYISRNYNNQAKSSRVLLYSALISCVLTLVLGCGDNEDTTIANHISTENNSSANNSSENNLPDNNSDIPLNCELEWPEDECVENGCAIHPGIILEGTVTEANGFYRCEYGPGEAYRFPFCMRPDQISEDQAMKKYARLEDGEWAGYYFGSAISGGHEDFKACDSDWEEGTRPEGCFCDEAIQP